MRIALLVGALLLSSSVSKAATAQLYAAGYFQAGIFGTTGTTGTFDPINMGITQPRGGLVLDSHVWVGDGALNWTKLTMDPALGIAEPRTPPPDLIGEEVAVAKVGQAAFDSGRSMAYLPSGQDKTGGVYRAVFTPGQTTGSFTLPVLLAPTAGLAGNRPTSVALGPDGQLYVGFLNTGDIRRINNPAGASQTVQTIGKSTKGGRVLGLVFVGSDLYLAEKDGFSVIRNATACNSGCQAALVPNTFAGQAHQGIATDGADTIYLAVANTVMRYSISARAQVLYANSGRLPLGQVVAFDMVAQQAPLFLDPVGNLYLGDDPTGGVDNFNGRLWLIPAGSAPVQ